LEILSVQSETFLCAQIKLSYQKLTLFVLWVINWQEAFKSEIL